MAEAKTDPKPVEQPVEAAAPDKAPAAEPSTARENSVTTTVWSAGKNVVKEDLFKQAKANVRDAIPVASYDVRCEVVGTKAQTVAKTAGTAWEVKVTYTPRANVAKPEPVDLERIIAEAQSGYGTTHAGDPDFLKDDE